MNKFIAVLLGIAILLLSTACSSTPVLKDQSNFVVKIYEQYPDLKRQSMTKATVNRVVDGDTFQTSAGDKVRLIGVNTPETVKPNSSVEAYGKEASAYTKQALTGKTVYMFQDVENKDKYGRLLRYVFIDGDQQMFNERLVREGYAETMTIPPNVMYQKLFLQANREARENNRGLWATGTNSKSSANVPSGACQDPKIKGNINTKGEKIYHLPGGNFYDKTVAEMMFCTEKEAQDNGFRKSAN